MGSEQEQQTWAPVMSWSGPNVPDAVDESTLGSVSQFSVTFPVTLAGNGAQYTCDTSFNQPPTPEPGFATNAPDHTNRWTSDLFNVQCKF